MNHNYNGYTSGTTVLSEANPKINLTPDFLSGPAANAFGILGNYYYPATGGSSSLANLINAGDVLSSSLGLDTYTTQVSQNADMSKLFRNVP